MSELKCPFCQQELNDSYYMACNNPHCDKTTDMVGTEELWQELIRTRKALDVAVDALKLTYQGNGDPQDIMRYKDNRWTSVRSLCKQSLEQITALEQKD